MQRRLAMLGLALFAAPAFALGLAGLSDKEAVGGLKDALVQASAAAVGKLGIEDGFYKNPQVRIPLPESLKSVEKGMRVLGMGRQADDLVLRMNRAAEAAVPEAKPLLVDAVKHMSVHDAKAILSGPDDAATQYFRKNTAAPLAAKFLPVVQKATADLQLARYYNRFADAGVKYGLLQKDQADLDAYVTHEALDGLYLMMAEEEKAIRKDPLGASTQLIKKAFGALR
ncbi:MAG: DUF4197 domain-containing protein [Methylobacterium sp.]|nr:DUF4197 domain-containing protein [Methylobacterium sp.]